MGGRREARDAIPDKCPSCLPPSLSQPHYPSHNSLFRMIAPHPPSCSHHAPPPHPSLPPPPLPLPQNGVWLLQPGAAHGEPVWGVRAQAGLRCGQPTGQGVALLGGRRRVPGHTLHDKQGEAGWNGRPGGGGGRVGRAKGLTEQSARCICSARVRFKAVELCR